jgi:cytochrome P450
VLSDLVTARLEDGRALHDGELLSIIAQIAVAGHETSTNFLGNAIVVALTHAGLLERLRGDRGAIPDFLEEVLRFDPPLQCTYRRATSDFEIAGTRIDEGQTVAAFWAAAGYDPAVFEAPDTFQVGRSNARKHLAFGHGIHFCVGSELARLEGRLAFNALLDRLDDIELDRAASDLSHHPAFAHHGYRSIVLRFAAAESR